MQTRSVIELAAADMPGILSYWLDASEDHLVAMGVDLTKRPTEEGLRSWLEHQLALPHLQKQSYCLIWKLDDRSIGHTNINDIKVGEEAFMHLHLWVPELRQQGLGEDFVKRCIPRFFETFHLKRLYCEPYAKNPAPNRTMERLGFTFEKTYRTIPGSFSFEQEVNRWVLDC